MMTQTMQTPFFGFYNQPWITIADMGRAPYRLVQPSRQPRRREEFKQLATRTLASIRSAREAVMDNSPVFMVGGVVSMLFAMAAVLGLSVSVPASF